MRQLIRQMFVDHSNFGGRFSGIVDRPMQVQPVFRREPCFANRKSRFEAIPDPGCRFEIWDNENGEPVIHRGRLLSFATAKSAARVADALNRAAAGDSEDNFDWRSKEKVETKRFQARDEIARCPIRHSRQERRG